MYTDFLQGLGHDLRAVVDSKDNIRYTSSGKSLDLVLDHGLVGKLNEWLGVCECLWLKSVVLFGGARGSRREKSHARAEGIPEASDGYQTLRRE